MAVEWYRIPTGEAGTLITLRHMAELANRGARDPLVEETARAIVGRYPTATQRAAALRDWLGSHVRFREDPAGYELLTYPGEMLRQRAWSGHAEGDCDDVAILAGALGKAVGFGGRYRVLAFEGGPFAHVFTELADRGRGAWFEMDTTRPFQQLPYGVSRNVIFPF